MKRILTILIISIISTIFSYPALGQDKTQSQEIYQDFSKYIPDGLDKGFSYLIRISDSTTTKYSTGHNVNVRRYPDTESEILSQLLYNTSVEVIAEYNGWACIGTEDGIAFVCNEYLSNTEIPKNAYTEEELYIMAHVLAGECQGYSDEEQLKVGSVVLNRVKDERFPNTIADVVFQNRQYSCIYDGNYYRDPTERNWENAKYLLEYGSILPGYVVFQSRNRQGRGVYLRTEYHWYCY